MALSCPRIPQRRSKGSCSILGKPLVIIASNQSFFVIDISVCKFDVLYAVVLIKANIKKKCMMALLKNQSSVALASPIL
jgi:hypothetical protein